MTPDEGAASTRPKSIAWFIALLVAGLLGWAGWVLFRPPGPIGEPEDPAKVLIVSDNQADRASWLSNLGFAAEQVDLEAALAKAEEHASETPAATLLSYADAVGIGYVVFERTTTAVDLSGLALAPDAVTPSDADQFVVVSSGDLAFPHRVTVSPKGGEITLTERPRLLQALLAQERLAQILRAQSDQTAEALELSQQLGWAISLVNAHERLGGRARALRSAIDEALRHDDGASAKPVRLGEALECSEAFALADGGVLTLIRDIEIAKKHNTGPSLEYEVGARFDHYAKTDAEARDGAPCEALKHGRDPRELNMHVSASGDTVLVQLENRIEVWSVDPAGTCSLTLMGGFPSSRRARWGDARDSRVVRRQAAGGAAIEILAPPAKKPTRVVVPGCTAVADPIWVGGDHIAVSCLRESDPWLYILALEAEAIVAVPTKSIGPEPGPLELLDVPHGPSPRLIAVSTDHRNISIVTISKSLEELFPPELTERDSSEKWRIDQLPESVLQSTPIDRGGLGDIGKMAVSPDGRALALQVNGAEAWDIAIAALDPPGKPRIVVDNPTTSDEHPSFAADSKTLVWTAKFTHKERPLYVGQILDL